MLMQLYCCPMLKEKLHWHDSVGSCPILQSGQIYCVVNSESPVREVLL